MLRVLGYANRDINLRRRTINIEWRLKRRQDRVRHPLGLRLVGASKNHGKILVAQTSERVCFAQVAAQAQCDLLQQEITGSTPKRIINFFEIVKTENEQHARTAFAGGQQ